MNIKHQTLAQSRWSYGALFGAGTGALYALCLWGFDFLKLAAAHAYLPYLKLLLGMLLFGVTFGVAGWLTARLDKPWFGLLSWIAATWGVAWLMIGIPLRIVPVLYGWFNPDLQLLLDYVIYDELNTRFQTAFAILAVFSAFLGLVENMLVEHAVHAAAAITRLVPFFIALAAMLVPGLIMDELVNQQLRAAVVAVNRTIEYKLDHLGEEIDPTTARIMHLAALNTVQDLLGEQRQLVISTYDSTFGEVDVLVNFDGGWVECKTFYEQLGNCKLLELP